MDFSNFFKPEISNGNLIIINDSFPSRYDLSKNELPWDLGIYSKKIITRKLLEIEWNRYPGGYEDLVTAELSKYHGIETNRIIIGSGSSYLISLLLDALVHQNLIIPYPSFPLYAHYAQIRNIKISKWELLNEFEYNPRNLGRVLPGSTFIICSPNNPTGNLIHQDVLKTLLIENKESLIIIDQAYCEFSKSDLLPLLDEFPNLVLIRSFSKALASASIRLGYLFASKELILYLKKLKNPYLINPFTAITAEHILSDPYCKKKIQNGINKIVSERQRLFKLIKRDYDKFLRVFHSEGNFLFMSFFSQEKYILFCTNLKEAEIRVQVFEQTLSLRLTIGSKIQNNLFLEQLDKCVKC